MRAEIILTAEVCAGSGSKFRLLARAAGQFLFTMQSTVIENSVCPSCGAAVRAGALYCYNCGGALATAAVSDSQAGEISNGNLPNQSEASVATPQRERRRRREPVRTEVVWEPESGPGRRFVFLAIVVSMIVAAFVMIAIIVR